VKERSFHVERLPVFDGPQADFHEVLTETELAVSA
jgi:hypothetical protein